jgi:RHS repeat-associated protein
LPIVGDWNGDGTDTVGLYDPGTGNWFLKNTNSAGDADTIFSFGPGGSVGWLPVVGDWNGDSIDTPGLYNPTTGYWYLRNTNSQGNADLVFWYGPSNSTWLPVVGDWNADGIDTVGLYAASTTTWYLKNTNSGGDADLIFSFGYSDAKPVAGNWITPPAGQSIPRDGLSSVSYNAATNRINTSGWEYDAAGNQTRVQRGDGSWQRYVYDAAGRLVKVQDNAGATQIIHTYGASNHRLIEQVGNESSNQRTYYAWAGNSVIAEYEETAAAPTTPRWVKSYVYLGGRLLATLAPNGGSERVEYHHPDRLGTRLVSNNQDTTSFEQVALPFGTALDAESTGSTKRRFTSYDRSTVTGLDYAVNRHYDPLQGRFTQVDPIGMASTSLANPQTLNLYAYCSNDPINDTDPSGLGFFSFLGKVFGFFAKVAKWVAVVVAVAVLVAVAFPAFAPILGTVLFNTGIWQLGAGVSASFLTGGVAAAGIGLGATGYVLAGLAAVGAVNDFMAKKRKAPPKSNQQVLTDIVYKASLLLNKAPCRELLSTDLSNPNKTTVFVKPDQVLEFYQKQSRDGQLITTSQAGLGNSIDIANTPGAFGYPVSKFGPKFFRRDLAAVIGRPKMSPMNAQILIALHELGHATGAAAAGHYRVPDQNPPREQIQRADRETYES